ncbi:hypothetical protein [Streptomyces sp. IBSBF 2806]|uniref:hypothetical protein n=1 Tax=Streptomyces sp. IBSBF 2806 TaxID=2903529 RepID=UPI002FDC55C0
MIAGIERNVKAAHVSSNLARLASLVDAWDDYLNKATSEISKDDVVSLRSLAIEIRKLLLDASDECQWLLEATNGQGSFGDQYLEFINGLPVSVEVKSAVIDKASTSRSGEIVQYLREKVSILVNTADDEEAAIASEMRQVNETHLPPAQTNDHGYMCAVGAGMTLGGLLGGNPGVAGVGLIVMASCCD